MTLSALLSKFGVPNVLLEKARALTEHPQAHYINNRTMEVFQHVPDGGKEQKTVADRVKAACPPLDQWRKFVYCQSLTGPIFGEVDHFKSQTSPQQPAISPQGVAHLSQSRLLPMLLDSASAPNNSGRVLLGHQLKSFRQSPAGINLFIDSREASYSLTCQYLVAADGANSRVRQALGVKMVGQAELQHLVNIHFWAPGIARRLRIERPAMLYFVFSPNAVVVIVAHDLNEGEFVAQVPFFPPVQELAQFTASFCKNLLQQAIGSAEAHIVIKTVRSWTMSAQVAETFQVGNVFLAGDAAHRFPPAGGFGMNTGIQDAHNLAWKLAYVLGGAQLNTIAPDPARKFAGAELLDSYTAERLPVAQANTQLSVANFEEAMRVPKALGLDPNAAAVLSSTATAAHKVFPGLGKRILDAGMALGMAASGARGPLKSWRSDSLQAIFKEGASLRLQFPKEDLGFVYRAPSAVILPDACMEDWEWRPGAAGRAVSAAPEVLPPQKHSQTARDAPYKPSTVPGGRIPHVWLRLMYSRRPSHSLLDLVGDQWALILSATDSARVWSAAAANIRAEGFPLRIVHIVRSTQAGKMLCHLLKKYPAGASSTTPRPHSKEESASSASGAQPVKKPSRRQREVERIRKVTDLQVAWIHDRTWDTLRGVPEDGAILVRPDSHVAWRCVNGPPLEAGSAAVEAADRRLRTALSVLLHSSVQCLVPDACDEI